MNQDGILDQVVVGLDLPSGRKVIPVMDTFDSGFQVLDYYSGVIYEVQENQVLVDSPFDIVLLARTEDWCSEQSAVIKTPNSLNHLNFQTFSTYQ